MWYDIGLQMKRCLSMGCMSIKQTVCAAPLFIFWLHFSTDILFWLFMILECIAAHAYASRQAYSRCSGESGRINQSEHCSDLSSCLPRKTLQARELEKQSQWVFSFNKTNWNKQLNKCLQSKVLQSVNRARLRNYIPEILHVQVIILWEPMVHRVTRRISEALNVFVASKSNHTLPLCIAWAREHLTDRWSERIAAVFCDC